MVGRAQDATGTFRAFLWQPSAPNAASGTMIDLGTEPGAANAADINGAGRVVGSAAFAGEPDGFIWDPTSPNAASGSIARLAGIMPSGINQSGHICGSSSDFANPARALLFRPGTPNGTTGSLLDLGLAEGATHSFAFGLNNNGRVVGYDLFPPDFRFRGFVATVAPAAQDESVVHDSIGTLGGANSALSDINDDGIAVGYSPTAQGLVHGIRYDAASRELEDLNDIIDSVEAVLSQGIDINDQGAIAGTLINQSDEERAALVRPAEETPDLEITKERLGSADKPAVVGQVESFIIRVRNHSSTSRRVQVTDELVLDRGRPAADLLSSSSVSSWPGAEHDSVMRGSRTTALRITGDVPAGGTVEALVQVEPAREGRFGNTVELKTIDSGPLELASARAGPFTIVPPAPRDLTALLDFVAELPEEGRRGVLQHIRVTNPIQPIVPVTRQPAERVEGPFYVAFDGLAGGALGRPSGVTRNVAPLGSPYVKLKGPRVLKPGRSVQTTVLFKRTAGSTGPIPYTARILGGKGKP